MTLHYNWPRDMTFNVVIDHRSCYDILIISHVLGTQYVVVSVSKLHAACFVAKEHRSAAFFAFFLSRKISIDREKWGLK